MHIQLHPLKNITIRSQYATKVTSQRDKEWSYTQLPVEVWVLEVCVVAFHVLVYLLELLGLLYDCLLDCLLLRLLPHCQRCEPETRVKLFVRDSRYTDSVCFINQQCTGNAIADIFVSYVKIFNNNQKNFIINKHPVHRKYSSAVLFQNFLFSHSKVAQIHAVKI